MRNFGFGSIVERTAIICGKVVVLIGSASRVPLPSPKTTNLNASGGVAVGDGVGVTVVVLIGEELGVLALEGKAVGELLTVAVEEGELVIEADGDEDEEEFWGDTPHPLNVAYVINIKIAINK